MSSASERLVDSARALLWERGYTGTSPRAIQQRAGAGQGSMYHHFAGKHELARTAIERTAEELLGQAEAALAGPGTALERITAYLHREREVGKGCPIGRLTQDPEVMADPELRAPVERTLARLRARVAEVLDEGRRRGEPDTGVDPQAAAALVVAALQGGYVLARAAGSDEPFDSAVAGVLALLSP